MKKLLILIILFLASPALAQQCSEPVEVARMSLPTISGSVPVAAGGCTGSTPTCTGRETFDGASDCGDDTGNAQTCDKSWANLTNQSFPAYTGNAQCTGSGAPYSCCTGSGTGTCPAAYQGTRSILVQDVWTDNPTVTITATDEIVVSSIFSTHATNTNYAIQLRDSSLNELCRIEYGSGYIHATNTGGSAGGDLSASIDTKYYIKVRAKKGTGSDAQCECWISTNGTTWGSSSSSSNGTWTAQISKIGLSPGYNNRPSVMDDIRWMTGTGLNGTEVSY